MNTTPKQVEDLAAPIKNAFYAARRVPGRTMHQAADDAARALLAAGWLHHDTLPYIDCGCGRQIYLPTTDPDTNAAHRAIIRAALSDVADAMHSGALDYGPGNASAAIRDWMNQEYPETYTTTDDDQEPAPPILAELEEMADNFDASIDWSDGRNNYGDNEAYAACARDLRALIAKHRKG